MYVVLDVPGRSGIRIHPGNTIDAFLGCIGLGTSTGLLGKKRAVLNSRYAVKKFEDHMQGEKFRLIITEVYEHVN